MTIGETILVAAVIIFVAWVLWTYSTALGWLFLLAALIIAIIKLSRGENKE